MKLGISTYSLNGEIARGNMTLGEVLDWIAQNGGECAELVPFAYRFEEDGKIDLEAIRATVRRARDAGVELVNYSVLADLCKTGQDFENEVARLCMHVDIAAELGLPRMRHDVCAFRRPHGENTLQDFEKWMPVIVEGARRVCEHGQARGVMTMIENHGFFCNGMDRVERIIDAVNHPNYGLLLDTGNIACVDEDPTVACLRLAKRTNMVHLKDFYIRKRDPGDTTLFDCGGHWFRSGAGRYLRGAILAQGDLDIWDNLAALKTAGYDGPIAIEFEGLEDAKYASLVSLQNARRIWNEV